MACEDLLTLELSIAAIEEYDRNQWETLEDVLGTSWTSDQIKSLSGGAQDDKSEKPKQRKLSASDRVRIPMLMGVKPEIIKWLIEQYQTDGTLGDGRSTQGAQSLWDLPKEQFLSWMGQVDRDVQSKGLQRPKQDAPFQSAESDKKK